MSFRTVETVFGYSDGRPGLRSRFSGCSDAIAPALGDELLFEVGDSTVGMEYEFAGGGCSIEVFFEVDQADTACLEAFSGFGQLAQRTAQTRRSPGWGWTRRSASPGGVEVLSAPLT